MASPVAITCRPDGAGTVIPNAVRDLNEKSAGALGSWQGSPEKSVIIHFDFERSEGPVGEMLDFGILDAGLFGI